MIELPNLLGGTAVKAFAINNAGLMGIPRSRTSDGFEMKTVCTDAESRHVPGKGGCRGDEGAEFLAFGGPREGVIQQPSAETSQSLPVLWVSKEILVGTGEGHPRAAGKESFTVPHQASQVAVPPSMIVIG